ncbi:MAG: hypothetical protein UT24_C0053G0004 [Candidatus Woesebacteria bacterium GW2011_GWB1_39_12]|uniref:Uncharacterized protein n=1 Tax=Candidatus Woesebacteria bacterium GW2011_GWB1_39_12 TaxID=1618574 RepID=A0A0G0M1G5_9BACT|nr:MAG: hypothetical protein UT24_C0053G0004 [Candidatus Woesebacteria bacterium GW2011_GWB1_39_12]
MAENTIEIIQGISQVMANKHDGCVDESGEPILIGLRREEPVSIHDKRIMDGFGVNINGNKLKLSYHGQISLKEVYETKFEEKITDIIEQCAAFLKREYKKVTKKALGLKMIGEPTVRVEHMNKTRSWVLANCIYELIGLDGMSSVDETAKERLDAVTKNWAAMRKKQ